MRTTSSSLLKSILITLLALSMLFQNSVTVFAEEEETEKASEIQPEEIHEEELTEEPAEETIDEENSGASAEEEVQSEESAVEEPLSEETESEIQSKETKSEELPSKEETEIYPAEETVAPIISTEPSENINDDETTEPNEDSTDVDVNQYENAYTVIKALLYHGHNSVVYKTVQEVIFRDYPQTLFTDYLMSSTSWKNTHIIWKTVDAFKDLGIPGVYKDKRTLIGYCQGMLLQFLTEYTISDEKVHEVFSDVLSNTEDLIDYLELKIPDYSEWDGRMPSEEIRNDILLKLDAPDPEFKELTDRAHSLLDTYGEVVDLGQTLHDGLVYAETYMHVVELTETQKELLKDMLAVVQSKPEFKTTVWEDALKELIDGMDDVMDAMLNRGKQTFKDVMVENVLPLSLERVKDFLVLSQDVSLAVFSEVASCLAAFLKAANITIRVGQKVCNYLFSADEVVELYDRMAQTQNFLVLLEQLYLFEQENCNSSPSLLSFRKLVMTLEMFFPLYDQGNEFTREFIDKCYDSKYGPYLISSDGTIQSKQSYLDTYTDTKNSNKQLEKKLDLEIQRYIYNHYKDFYFRFFSEVPPFPVPVTGIRYDRERVEYGISKKVWRGTALIPVLNRKTLI